VNFNSSCEGFLAAGDTGQEVRRQLVPQRELRLRVAQTIDQVEELRDIWERWSCDRDNDIDFYLKFVISQKTVIHPYVIVLYRQGAPESMLVGRLELRRISCKLGYLTLSGINARLLTFPYKGLLGCSSVANCVELIKHITDALRRGEADVALLEHVDTHCALYKMARILPGRASRDYLVKIAPHHVMRLFEDVNRVYQGLSPGLRSEVRRKKRNILRKFSGSTTVECFQSEAELQTVIPQIEEIARQTYQRGLGVGFQDNDQTRARLSFCSRAGWLRVYVLSIEGTPCAFWIGTVYDSVFFSEYNGFDPHFSEYSVGTVLLIAIVEDLCVQGVTAIDFGFGSAEYKDRFGNCQLMESSVYIFAPTVRGLALNLLHTSLGLADRAARQILERAHLLQTTKRLMRTRAARNAAA